MKTGYLGDSCAIEMYISKNYLYKYMYFFVQNKLSVSFQPDKTDYVLYLLTFDATNTWKEG